MNPNVYAKTVVKKVIKSNPPQEIWCGSGAFTVWLVETLGVRWAYTLVFSKMFGLNDMAPSSEQGE
jgi:1-acylglycerone phosphate reductase